MFNDEGVDAMKNSSKMIVWLDLIIIFAPIYVFAESATDTVDARVGIQPALELVCSDVSFGVWRVPARTGGATTITLDYRQGNIVASGNTNRIAHSTANASWLHQRGVCVLSGSTAANGAAIAVALSNSTAISFDAANSSTTGFSGLAAATKAATGLQATLNSPNSVNLGTDGSVTFYVGGVLTVPGLIDSSNHGGYRASNPATVTVDDGV